MTSVENPGASPAASDPLQDGFMKAIQDLQDELKTLAIKIALAGKKPASEVDPWIKDLKTKKNRMRELQELCDEMNGPVNSGSVASVALSSQGQVHSSFLVPAGLPLFQWDGMVVDQTRTVYGDMDACVLRFEDVLQSHGLDFDRHWNRLLPCCLGPDLREWLNEYVKNTTGESLTWEVVKAAMVLRFGVPKEQLRLPRVREFLNIVKTSSESVDAFLERFKKLQAKAEVYDNYVVCTVMFDAFPVSFRNIVTVSMTQVDESKFFDPEYMVTVLRRIAQSVSTIDGTLVPNGLQNRKRVLPPPGEAGGSSEAKKSRWAPSGSSGSKSQGGNNGNRGGGFSSRGQTGKRCYRCGSMDWSPHHHVCVDTAVKSDGGRVLRMMSSVDDAVNVAVLSAASGERNRGTNQGVLLGGGGEGSSGSQGSVGIDEPMDGILESGDHGDAELSDLEGRAATLLIQDCVDVTNALNAQECKFDVKFSTAPTMSSNSICVPIVVQNVLCFGLVDSGATFSCVTKEFFEFLGGELLHTYKLASGVVQLGHVASSIPRSGSVDLKLFYNKYAVTHNFEIFDFYSSENVHILLGMDILSKIGIGITGLVSQHFTQIGPKIPDPIDPDNVKPNEDPFGTVEERLPFEKLLKELLDSNSKIDMKNTSCNLPDSEIKLTTKPGCVAWRAQYPLPEAYREAVAKQIQVWLDEGVICRSKSHTEYNSPLLCVKKKNSDGEYTFEKPRVVCDVRKLNSILVVDDRQQLPLIASIHERIGNKTIHTCLDIHACFTSFSIAKGDTHKISFTCPFTNIQYSHLKAAYGIKHVGSVVTRTLQNLITDLNKSNALSSDGNWSAVCYVDDIVLSTSGSLTDHFELVSKVIQRLTRANLMLNPEKVVFAQQSIHLLGWSVIKGVLIPDPRKVANVAAWGPIKTGKQLASFLGLLSFFRSSIPCYSRLTRDLDQLKCYKDLSEVWTPSHDTAVQNLKDALCMAPVISTVRFDTRLQVATDASLSGIGGILYQVVDNEIKYIGLVSRKLSVSERNYSTTKRELLAVVYTFKKFHRWLYMRPFTLHIDHKSLVYLNVQDTPNSMMLNWYELIFSYTFEVVHIPGIFNQIPDALSRLYEDDDADARHLVGGSYASGNKKVKNSKNMYTNKRKAKGAQSKNGATFNGAVVQRQESLQDMVDDDQNESVSDRKEAIIRALKFSEYMTPPKNQRDNLIIRAHLLGHYGVKHVEQQLHRDGVHWKNIRKDIERILSECLECNKFNIAKEGYHPFRSNKVDQPLDHWALDLGDFGVTSINGSNFILVMVDYFSRFTIIRCLPDKRASSVAKELLQVFSIFGFPKALSMDNGTEFLGAAVTELLAISGISKFLSAPYNPLGNSVAEAFVKVVKGTTIKMLQGKRDQWESFIPWVNFCVNVKYARLHKSRPYAIVFSRQPNMLEDYAHLRPTMRLEKADHKLIDERYKFVHEIMIPALSKRILETQDGDHKYFAKKNKVVDAPYPIGSKVMIKNVNRQNKLDERYEGPYRVHNITTNGCYVLMDRTGALLSRDVPTHHIIYKKAANPKPVSVDEFCNERYEIQAVIDHAGSPGNYMYKVHWKGYDDENEHTWEPVDNFDSNKHIAIYWSRLKGAKAGGKRKRASETVNRREVPAQEQSRLALRRE